MRRTAIKSRRKFKGILFLILIATMATVLGWDLGAELGLWSDSWDDSVLGPLFAVSAVSIIFVGFIPNQTPVKRTRDDRIADSFKVSIALLTGAAGWYVLRDAIDWGMSLFHAVTLVVVTLVLLVVTAMAIFVPMRWDRQNQVGQDENHEGSDDKERDDQWY